MLSSIKGLTFCKNVCFLPGHIVHEPVNLIDATLFSTLTKAQPPLCLASTGLICSTIRVLICSFVLSPITHKVEHIVHIIVYNLI